MFKDLIGMDSRQIGKYIFEELEDVDACSHRLVTSEYSKEYVDSQLEQ